MDSGAGEMARDTVKVLKALRSANKVTIIFENPFPEAFENGEEFQGKIVVYADKGHYSEGHVLDFDDPESLIKTLNKFKKILSERGFSLKTTESLGHAYRLVYVK